MRSVYASTIVLIALMSIQTIVAQEVRMTLTSRSINELVVDRMQSRSWTGVLLDFEKDSLLVRRGTFMKKEAGYSYYKIHTTVAIPVRDLKAVSFRKKRIGGVLIGALGGLVIGGIVELAKASTCLPISVLTASNNDCSNGSAVVAGVAVGALIGLGITFAINPKKTNINGNPLIYRNVRSRLSKYGSWKPESSDWSGSK